MLSCIVGKTSINTFEYKEEKLREWSNKGMLKCPECGEKVLYCHGDFKIPYFRHEKSSNCDGIYSEPYTEEHIEGIKTIYEWLKSLDGIEKLEVEKYIENTRQRPDIYFEYKGKRCCIEYQCSPIATKFNDRRDLYRLEGINDIWILGKEKYEINIWESISNINCQDIEISDLKFKTIEKEIIDSEGRILYLHSNGISKIKRIKNIGLKTRFGVTIDSSVDINDLLYDEVFSKESLFGSIIPEFNLFNTKFYKIISELNNSGCEKVKYDAEINIKTNGIFFRIYRTLNCGSDGVVYFKRYQNTIDDLNGFFEKEKYFIKNIIDVNDNLEISLKESVEKVNSKFFNGDIISVDNYCGNIQISVNIKNVKRLFIIDLNKSKMECGKWKTHQRFVGMSRKGKKKYEKGWHLEILESYGFDVNLGVGVITNKLMSYIFSYYDKELKYNVLKLSDSYMLTEEQEKLYNSFKSLSAIISNKLNSLKNRFSTTDNQFEYSIRIKYNKIIVDIRGVKVYTIEISKDLVTINEFLKDSDDKIEIQNIEVEIDNVIYIMAEKMSEAYRNKKYNLE